VPTMLMGATLPLLVEHLVCRSQNVGRSVGGLYFVNTLGSGMACFLAATVLMRRLGQSGSVLFAAGVNALVALGALVYGLRSEPAEAESETGERWRRSSPHKPFFPFCLALLCAAFSGCAALSYEIIWYRLLTFASDDTASAFACLLGSYLLGLALGSRFIERYSLDHGRGSALPVLGNFMLGSAVIGFAVGPGVGLIFRFASPNHPAWPAYFTVLLLICFGALLFGAIFPLIAHVSVHANPAAGAAVSYLYAANIVGSTVGTLVVGFILMDRFSLFQISLFLLLSGVLLAAVIFGAGGQPIRRLISTFVPTGAGVLLVIVLSRPVFNTIYDRLLFKNKYPALHFERVVENRSGTIGVTPDGVVFGGGVYDGRFSTDLLHDVNIIVRPYALSAFHAAPRHVLMIGLGSGSWAQVVANHPQLEDLTIVEINPGYVDLIPQHPQVASLLRNPRVRIVIDDGRRWLVRNPGEKFDAIVMNTTFHWRNHSSNLLSVEFLQIARQHLNSGGVLFYNTTGSDDVIATGLSVYPYALRFLNSLAVSDSPLMLDPARWKTVLLGYVIDGKHLINANDPQQMKKLDEIVNIKTGPPGPEWKFVEDNDQLRRRVQGRLIITDDNMGLEWR